MNSAQLNPAHQRAISTLLQLDMQLIDELRSLLLEERDALRERNYQAQSHLIEQKSQRIATLESNREKRYRFLTGLELPTTKESWEALIASADDTVLTDQWQELQSAFTHCQQLNEVNGKMIGRSRQIMGKLLNFMRGQVSPPDLYTQSGNTQNQTTAHTVVKA